MLEQLFPKNLYHSYVVEGEPESLAKELLLFLEARNEIQHQSPDVLCQVYKSFGMEDSNEVKNWHSKASITNTKKVCIIATKFINREAEQTLLKVIEEPGDNTHFFIVIPDSSVLSPTIISRVHIIKTEREDDKNIKKQAVSFVNSTPKNRIDSVALMIKENKKEDNSGQLRSYATLFINELENIFYQKFKKNIKDKNVQFILSELQKAREYLSLPGCSVKMILEHLSLII